MLRLIYSVRWHLLEKEALLVLERVSKKRRTRGSEASSWPIVQTIKRYSYKSHTIPPHLDRSWRSSMLSIVPDVFRSWCISTTAESPHFSELFFFLHSPFSLLATQWHRPQLANWWALWCLSYPQFATNQWLSTPQTYSSRSSPDTSSSIGFSLLGW